MILGARKKIGERWWSYVLQDARHSLRRRFREIRRVFASLVDEP